MTRSYLVGLIGSGIGSSSTPALHESEADAHGVRYLYRTIDIDALGRTAADGAELVRQAQELGYDALNITHPCKQTVLSALDELSPDAELLGAVNTVVFRDGRAIGANTDHSGFAQGLRDGLDSPALDRVVLLGSGGAGSAIAFALLNAGTRVLSVFDPVVERARAVRTALGPAFPGAEIVAIGADDDMEQRRSDIVDAVARECEVRGIPLPHLAFEPGRTIVGRAGVTLYEVGTVKPVQVSDELERLYVSVDGGMSDNARPALYGAQYSARLASRTSDAAPALARVVGRHCESGDIVVDAEYLPGDVTPGDLLAVPATGAYCFSLSSNYNYVPRPPVVAVRDGAARVIVRGETIDDLLARDLGVASGSPSGEENE